MGRFREKTENKAVHIHNIITHAHVTGLTLEGEAGGTQRATGVTFRRRGSEQAIHAGREVILSAGAIQSPQILELSGIGEKAE